MSNAISKSRLKLLFNFYRPALIRQLPICGILLLALYALTVSAVAEVVNYDNRSYVLQFSFASSCVTLLYFAGPLVFAWCRNRSALITLPATWQEKALLMLGYVLIIYPAFLAALWYAAMGITSLFSDFANPVSAMTEYLIGNGGEFMRPLVSLSPYANASSAMTIALATCLTIVLSRKHRMARAVGTTVGGLLVLFIVGAVMGFTAFVKSKFSQVAEGATIMQSVFSDFFDSLSHYFSILGIVTLLLSVVLIVAIVLIIKNRQA